MTAANRYAQAYRTTSVETASPAKLILMLFDGATRFLHQALTGFDLPAAAVRNETITGNIIKAQRIIAELRCSLNLEKGGEVGQTLYRLYNYMDDQLREANVRKDRAPIVLTQELIGEIRTGWAQMMAQQPAALAA